MFVLDSKVWCGKVGDGREARANGGEDKKNGEAKKEKVHEAWSHYKRVQNVCLSIDLIESAC